MSIKSQSNKNYWNQSNIFFSPKLSLQGRNMLPQIIQPSISFHRDQPFLTVLKKPIMNVYQNATVRKQRKPVCVIGRVKQLKQAEKRQTNTGSTKKRTFHEYDFAITKGTTIQHIMSLPKSMTQKNAYPSQKHKEDQYYYYIGLGNNSSLVEKVLMKRQNWSPTTTTLYNLRWQQTRPKYYNKGNQKQLINHLPNHQQISDKGSLLKNMKAYCQKFDEQLFNILPVCFQFDFDSLELCENELKKFVQYFWQDQQKINNKQNKQQIKQSSMKIIPSKKRVSQTTNQLKLSPKKCGKSFRTYRKDNFCGNQINRKKTQIKILYQSLVAKMKPYHNFQDMSPLKRQPLCLIPSVSDIYGETCLWLLKPTDLNRGRGIKLFKSLQQLGQLIQTQLSKNQKGSFIVQKYIQKPLLINQRKFDIRIWVMMTQNKQIYYFKEGYIRTSCQKYSLDCLNQYTHLTNNAIQKTSKNYGIFQDGNQISLNMLYELQLVNKQQFINQMKKYISISFSSVMDKLFNIPQKMITHNTLTNYSLGNFTNTYINNQNNHSKIKYFEIFGYDFMVDVDKHLWLIEVNTNPCLQESSSLLKNMMPRMLDDAFKLTIDKSFSKVKLDETTFPVKGYQNNINMWQHIPLFDGSKSAYEVS